MHKKVPITTIMHYFKAALLSPIQQKMKQHNKKFQSNVQASVFGVGNVQDCFSFLFLP